MQSLHSPSFFYHITCLTPTHPRTYTPMYIHLHTLTCVHTPLAESSSICGQITSRSPPQILSADCAAHHLGEGSTPSPRPPWSQGTLALVAEWGSTCLQPLELCCKRRHIRGRGRRELCTVVTNEKLVE